MKNFAVIGVGNMATSILSGMVSTQMPISEWVVFDKFKEQYDRLPEKTGSYRYAESIREAVSLSDCVLLSVKPQNFSEVLAQIREANGYKDKLYISIAAGITSASISEALDGAGVVRVLPNLPMTIGMGVSLICENDAIDENDMQFVRDIFASSGSILMIREEEK